MIITSIPSFLSERKKHSFVSAYVFFEPDYIPLKPRCGEPEPRKLKAMFTECISWVPILLENHGIFLTLLPMQLLKLCKTNSQLPRDYDGLFYFQFRIVMFRIFIPDNLQLLGIYYLQYESNCYSGVIDCP